MSFETPDLNTVAPMSPYVFCISCCHCVYTECTIVHSNSLFQLFSKHELRVFRLPARRDDACVRAPWAWDGVACMRSRVWCVTYGFPCMGSRVWCVAYAVRASDTHTRGHIGIFLWQGHVAGMWQVVLLRLLRGRHVAGGSHVPRARHVAGGLAPISWSAILSPYSA